MDAKTVREQRSHGRDRGQDIGVKLVSPYAHLVEPSVQTSVLQVYCSGLTRQQLAPSVGISTISYVMK
ncbi:hypothetical protein BRADI_2g44217v3 [Brachypodium distachyon]|uniref:Uncharacterized protein n=1 Tax=Brachypodium distachyon TaxID=15368 RepID=A0A2K2DDS0_BRADI|nr:hypothetical protein BRADI_2g44217v3 [Brachypodium distachyon]